MEGQRTNEGGGADAGKLLAVLTSTVCEAVEDVAFITQALEAPGRVDAEMVAGAVEGALVDVCAQREKHVFRTNTTSDGKRPIAVLLCIHRLLFLPAGRVL